MTIGVGGYYDRKALKLDVYRAALFGVYEPGTRERGIIERHWKGMIPAEIDRDMLLPKGTARDVIVTAWAEVKALGKDYFKGD